MIHNDIRLSIDHDQLLTKDDLYQELNELLSAFCSEAQQQFCMDQAIITREDFIQIKNTIQQIQQLLPTADHHNNHHLRQTLGHVIKNILHYYGEAFKIRNMTLFNDDTVINQYISEWHKLNKLLDNKKKDHHHLQFILNDLSHLSRLWKQYHHHPFPDSLSRNKYHYRFSFTKKLQQQQQPFSTFPLSSSININNNEHYYHASTMTSTEDIVTSILTSFDFPIGAYMVIIDKYNYGQLGFPYKKIGTRHIIFDSFQLSLKDMMTTVTDICTIFYDLFSATAQQHLSQTDAQVRKSKPTFILNQLNRLSSNIINRNNNHTRNNNNNNRNHRHHTEENNNNNNNNDKSDENASTRKDPIFHNDTSLLLPTTTTTSFRLSLTSPNTITLLQHPIPIPSFIPPPWMWPDLLKLRYPYDPYLFGLIRRHPTTKQQHQYLLMKHLHTSPFSFSTSSVRDHHHHPHKRRKSIRKKSNYPEIENNEEDEERVYSTATFIKPTTSIDNKKKNYHHQQQNLFNLPLPIASSSNITTTTTTTTTTAHHASKGRNRDNHADFELENDPSINSNQQHDQQQQGINIKQSLSLLSSLPSSDDMNSNKKKKKKKKRIPPYTSISIEQLCIHLSKVASQFYDDLYTHTLLRYQETQTHLQTLEWDLLNIYRHLQIASSNAVMERALALVQDIDDQSIHLFQQQQEEKGEEEDRHRLYQQQHENNDDNDDDDEEQEEENEKKKKKEKEEERGKKKVEKKEKEQQDDSSISSIGEYITDHHHHQGLKEKKTTTITTLNQYDDSIKKKKKKDQDESTYSIITHKTDTAIPFYQTSSSLITPLSGNSSSTIPNIIINDQLSSSMNKKVLHHKRHSLEKHYKQVNNNNTMSITPSLTTTTTTSTTTS